MRRKAIIIGAGISGLASAIALKKIGYEVVINEKSPVLKNSGGGLTLWNNALNALGHIGISESLYAKGKIFSGGKIVTQNGKKLADLPLQHFSHNYGGKTMGILRSELYSVLLDYLTDVQLKTNRKLIRLQQDQDQVVAYFENGDVETGDLLIGADGIHSNVRKQIFDDNPSLRWSGYTSWRGVTTFDPAYCKKGLMLEVWGNGIRFGCVPVSNEKMYWFAAKNSDRTSVSFNKEDFQNFIDPVPTIIKLTKEENILHTDIYDLKPLASWTSGRVVLIGDAAHATTPNLGQGACLSLEDAVELAQFLKREGAIEQQLKAFETSRIKRVRMMVTQSWNLGKVAQMENVLLCYLRNEIVKAAPKAIQNLFFNKTIGYKMNKGDSSWDM